MNRLKTLLLVAGIGLVTACQPNQQRYVQQQPQMVTVYDNNGQAFLMNAILYQQMMNNGGRTRVLNHYRTNRNNTRYYARPAVRSSAQSSRQRALQRARTSSSRPVVRQRTSSPTRSSFFRKSSPSRSSSYRSSSRSSSRSHSSRH